MTGEALKRIAVSARAGDEPSLRDQGAALAEGIDLLLGLAADLKRIGDSLEKLAECRVEVVGGWAFDARDGGVH